MNEKTFWCSLISVTAGKCDHAIGRTFRGGVLNWLPHDFVTRRHKDTRWGVESSVSGGRRERCLCCLRAAKDSEGKRYISSVSSGTEIDLLQCLITSLWAGWATGEWRGRRHSSTDETLASFGCNCPMRLTFPFGHVSMCVHEWMCRMCPWVAFLHHS